MPGTRSSSWTKLASCLSRLTDGPWRFIQLRGWPIGETSIDGDDIDLLGSRESVEALVSAAFEWARAGECHFRVDSRDRCKTLLSLISIDGQHRLDLDLWIELWQIDHRNRCLCFEECAPILTDDVRAIRRFPLPIEVCIYIHHLASKRRDPSAPSAMARLAHYSADCHRHGHSVLAAELDRIVRDQQIEPATMAEFTAPLEASIRMREATSFQRRWAKATDQLAAAWLGAPRRVSLISVMGCDGAGKTTLARRLTDDLDFIGGVLTGKHLYRKSWFYKLTVIFIRPLMFQDREKYDETLAPLVYLRACLGLRIKLWRSRGLVHLIDRSITDFLMVDRKTDVPRFCRSLWLAKFFGRRIPIIHCVLPYARVLERKDEMTEAGHDAYDTAIFRHLSRRVPTDYVVFNNSGTLEESALAAGRIIAWMRKIEPQINAD